jgi:tRNA pseudouridine38-40 synthase
LEIVFRRSFTLTGSSRTDSGVHAFQNYFHFDYEGLIDKRILYNINALLPPDIVLKNIWPVAPNAHCRYDALSREYRYYIYRAKNPFLADRAWFFPYTLDRDKLAAVAALIPQYEDFTTFSKRNTQAKTRFCAVLDSGWQEEGECLVYRVVANRFLRGMVRGLVGTMLQVGRGKISVEEFAAIIGKKDNQLADFSAPGHGLFLFRISFPDSIFLSAV